MKFLKLTPRIARVTAQTVGLLLLGIGTAAIDWRAAAVLIGSILFASSVHASMCAMRPPTN